MSILGFGRKSCIQPERCEREGGSASDSRRWREKGGWIKKRGESNRERGCKEKWGRSDYEETEAKKKNLETDSRIMWVILGGVKVRTSTFSFFPSVIDLADELLWLFQFGSITLYSAFLYHSVQFNVGKKKPKQKKKGNSLWLQSVTRRDNRFCFFGGGVWIYLDCR